LVDCILPFLEEAFFIVIRDEMERERIILKSLALINAVEDIQPETVYALIQPKPDHTQHGVFNLRVAKIQIGLEWKERGVVPLVRSRIQIPT